MLPRQFFVVCISFSPLWFIFLRCDLNRPTNHREHFQLYHFKTTLAVDQDLSSNPLLLFRASKMYSMCCTCASHKMKLYRKAQNSSTITCEVKVSRNFGSIYYSGCYSQVSQSLFFSSFLKFTDRKQPHIKLIARGGGQLGFSAASIPLQDTKQHTSALSSPTTCNLYTESVQFQLSIILSNVHCSERRDSRFYWRNCVDRCWLEEKIRARRNWSHHYISNSETPMVYSRHSAAPHAI